VALIRTTRQSAAGPGPAARGARRCRRVGHPEVEDDEIGLELGDGARGGLAAVGLADELHAVARLHGARHPGAEHEAVVDDEDADRTGALRAAARRSTVERRAVELTGAGLPPVADVRDRDAPSREALPPEAP
jgi:hypothetical protein